MGRLCTFLVVKCCKRGIELLLDSPISGLTFSAAVADFQGVRRERELCCCSEATISSSCLIKSHILTIEPKKERESMNIFMGTKTGSSSENILVCRLLGWKEILLYLFEASLNFLCRVFATFSSHFTESVTTIQCRGPKGHHNKKIFYMKAMFCFYSTLLFTIVRVYCLC